MLFQMREEYEWRRDSAKFYLDEQQYSDCLFHYMISDISVKSFRLASSFIGQRKMIQHTNQYAFELFFGNAARECEVPYLRRKIFVKLLSETMPFI